MTMTPTELLDRHLHEPASGFSIGCLGAIAEFQEPEGPACTERTDGAFVAIGPRGAMRVEDPGRFQPIAYEALSSAADAWQCGVVFCSTRPLGRRSVNAVLTELGPDSGAIRAQDRDAVMFDVGIGMANVRFSVRTTDGELIDILRAHAGQRVTDEKHPVMQHIIDSSPHRVAESDIGRIEVYQRIDRHRTPSGPHTHLLPELLAKRRTHSANVPVPSDSLPLMTVHPENPLVDHEGVRRTFARRAFDRFEDILLAFGPAEYVHEKARLRAAVVAGDDPAGYRRPGSRLGRLAVRIALRQLHHVAPDGADVERWSRYFRT